MADRTPAGPALGAPAAPRRWPRSLAVLTAALVTSAAVGHLAILPQVAEASSGVASWPAWLALVAGFAVAEAATAHFQLGRQTVTYSLSEVPLVVGLALVDPVAVVAARLLGAGAVVAVGRRGRPEKLAYAVGVMWSETVVAALVWHLVLGDAAPVGPVLWGAALAAVAATDVWSATAVTAALRLTGARIGWRELPDLAVGTLVALANGSLAIVVLEVIAADWRATWALALVGVVLVAAYRSHSVLRRRSDSLERLARFSADLEGARPLDHIARELVVRAAGLASAEHVELVWTPPDAVAAGRAPLVVVGGEGRAPVVVADADAPPSAALGAGAEVVLVARHERDRVLRARLAAAGRKDAVRVPLVRDDVVFGHLLVADHLGDKGTFTVEDLRVLQALANQAAVTLANSQLNDDLRREAAQRAHEARHDALTGLRNRDAFLDDCRRALDDDPRAAVLLFDLDRFKEVNDTLGHPTGDRLLRALGERLAAALPAVGTCARLGGDEFAVLLPGSDAVTAATQAKRLRAVLAEPSPVGDLTVHTEASVGIAVAPDHGRDAHALLQRADVAMYSAKAGREGFALYAAERDHYSPRRLALVADLRDAVTDGDLQVHYQPKIDLATGAPAGVEALVRWQHPSYGLIPPDDFLPIAEHTDLMLPLTAHVLEVALRQCAAWDAEGLALSVAVNVSPRTLLEPELPGLVTTLLVASGLPPSRLTLEITEGTIIADPVRAVAVLSCFDELGVRLAVDDFGTGYSSLAYLRRLPVHELKIDKSFVLDLGTGSSDATIVEATVDLGHRLGLVVVAEGVETPEGEAALVAMGCDSGQGYLFSRPLPALAATEWLRGRAATHRLRVA